MAPSLHLLAGLLALVLAVLSPGAEGECTAYSSTLCGDVIDTYASGQVYGNQFVLALTEGFLVDAGLQNISIAGPILFPECYDIARRFICGYYFPECSTNNTKIPICRGICTEFKEVCKALIESEGLDSSLPSCSTIPEENCTSLHNLPPLDISSVVCPAPLVRNHDGKKRMTCPGGVCCVPCPSAGYFFKEGMLNKGFIAISVFSVINTIFILLVVISYLAFKSKRTYPARIITAMSISILIVYSQTWLGIIVGSDTLLCSSDLDLSTPGNATPYCEAQGFLLIFGTFSAILWFACMSANIFTIIILRRDPPWYTEYIIHSICWGVPAISAITLLVKDKYGTSLSPMCGVPDLDSANAALFIPAAIVLFPAFLANMGVFAKVFMVAREVKRPIRTILKMQLRPLIFSTYALSIFVMYWIYIQTNNTPTGWMEDWFLCLALGYGQNECSKISAPNLNIETVFGVYFMLQTFGLVGFAVFVLKADVLRGWKKIFQGQAPSEADGYTSHHKETTNHRTGMADKSVPPTYSTNNFGGEEPQVDRKPQPQDDDGDDEIPMKDKSAAGDL